MTYRVRMVVRNNDGAAREVITNLAGCLNEEDAKAKAKALYDVVSFKSIEEAKK